jgi:hypothetical protein
MSVITLPDRIVFTIARVTMHGARLPGISTAPISRSAVGNRAPISSRKAYSAVTLAPSLHI